MTQLLTEKERADIKAIVAKWDDANEVAIASYLLGINRRRFATVDDPVAYRVWDGVKGEFDLPR